MIRRSLVGVLVACALVAMPLSGSAQAQFFSCLPPDDDPPVIHNLDVRPSFLPRGSDVFALVAFYFDNDPTQLGARVTADVWDLPNQDPTNQHNGIQHVLLEIDDAGVTEVMNPLPDGRYGKIRQPVEYVLEPGTLVPGEIYTLRLTGTDACGNVTSRQWRIMQVTLLATIVCDNAPRGVC